MDTVNRSITQPRDETGPGPDVQSIPQYAFVLGVARSGTSAMARLLNAHPSVCMGLERYKHFYRRERGYPPSLLTKERFFSFHATDTNARAGKGNENWDRFYETMKDKWDTAKIIGDKEGYAAIDYIIAEIPAPRIVFMLRDVHQVASSWNVRAVRNVGAWPAKDDYRIAVHRWNEANALAYSYLESLGDRLLLLDYGAFFSGSEKRYPNLLLQFLGLEPDEPKFITAYRSSVRHYLTEILSKQPVVMDGQSEYIERETNLDTYRRLTDLAKAQLARL